MISPEVRQELLKGVEKVSPEAAGSMVVMLEEIRAEMRREDRQHEDLDELIEAGRDYHDLLVELRGTMNTVGYTQMARLLTLTEVGLLAFKDAITKEDVRPRDIALGMLIEGVEVLASSEYTLLPVEDIKGLLARYAVRLPRYLWDTYQAFGQGSKQKGDPAGDIKMLVSYLSNEKVRIAGRTVVLIQTYRWVMCAGLYTLARAQAQPKKK